MKIDLSISRAVDVIQTARVQQLAGMFDLPPATKSQSTWHHQFQLPEKWNVGVIVGPSGSGKSTLIREAFKTQLVDHWDWPGDKSIVDGFPSTLGIRDITGLLSSVGFSSPPAWLRPFAALSNGEQFRVTVARTLAEMPELAVVDEFTSVVDRQVAQIGSAAIAKAVRRRNQKFIAVTCHYDVLDWLEPDWVYEPHTGKFTENSCELRVVSCEENAKLSASQLVTRNSQLAAGACASRGFLHRSFWNRPQIHLEIAKVHPSAWVLFRGHHYLSSDISRSSRCFAAFWGERPVAFVAVLSFPHPVSPSWREHRCVCLPEFQGVGIGNAVSECVASMFKSTGKPYTSVTSSPAMIRHRKRSRNWRVKRDLSIVSGRHNGLAAMGKTSSHHRFTAGFEFAGRAMDANLAERIIAGRPHVYQFGGNAQKVIEALQDRPGATVAWLATNLGLAESQIRNVLDGLKRDGSVSSLEVDGKRRFWRRERRSI